MDPSEALKRILETRGTRVCENLPVMEALLLDFCPNDRGRVNCLVNALRERVPQTILGTSPGANREALRGKLRERLHSAFRMEEMAADWTVVTWMSALLNGYGAGLVEPLKPLHEPGLDARPPDLTPEAPPEKPPIPEVQKKGAKRGWMYAARQPAVLPALGSPEETDLLIRAAQEIRSGKPRGTARQAEGIVRRFKGIDTGIAQLVAQGVPADSARILLGYSLKARGSSIMGYTAWFSGLWLLFVRFSGDSSLSPDDRGGVIWIIVIVAPAILLIGALRYLKGRRLMAGATVEA